MPRRLRLLHLRPSTAARRAGIPERGRGACDRPRGRGGRLHGGAVHAWRQAGAPLQGRARGARRARVLDDDRVPRPRREARARRDRPAPALESRRHDPRRARAPSPGLRLDGDHARDDRRSTRGARWTTLGFARQAARPPARDDRARRRASDPLHERDPDRDRRDAGRAARRAGGARQAPPPPRPPPGGDRPELPREARHADGRPRRAVARRPPLDDCRGAAAPARRRLGAGAAEPRVRRLPTPPRRRHRRLGRRLAGHDRPRESGGTVAGARPARRRHRARAGSSSRRGCPSIRPFSAASGLRRRS